MKFLIRILKSVWRKIKNESKLSGENFYSFGKNSIIVTPFTQMTGIDKVSIGDNTTILAGARICVWGDKVKSPSIRIGDRCYICYSITILGLNTNKIIIGNDVLFASYVFISSESHGIDPESKMTYMEQSLSGSDVVIGDGCWIGEKVCILPGVKIGKKCIIGAASVVTKSIPDYCVAVGNPARIVKKYNFDTHAWDKI